MFTALATQQLSRSGRDRGQLPSWQHDAEAVSLQLVESANMSPANRLFALDAQRGLIMVVMALDHANHFVAQQHSSGEYWGGPFPTYESARPFLTRLVAHIAAPGFFFLMGTGMMLFAGMRTAVGWDVQRICRHFWLCGLLLIFGY